ncbi:peptidyl-prolyl cis-trans isomerase 5-like [Ptychodera flava]|uniref:peptidyl-prolyl cis-trans isomerase 5-like n=1 Tax=Ptychodera flava TaxID=63121 RepID=UPI00396A33EF
MNQSEYTECDNIQRSASCAHLVTKCPPLHLSLGRNMKLLAITSVLFGLTNLIISTSAWDSSKQPKVTQKVLFDIEINGRKRGRIVIGLFGETVPKTVEIFAELAKAKEGEGYKGSKVFRAFNPYCITGGIISRDNGIQDWSAYGRLPNDENFALMKYSAGYVSFANSAESKASGTEFVINYSNLIPCQFGKNVVFGKVLEGMNVVTMIASMCRENRRIDCVIADSEIVEVDEPFMAPV